MTRQLMMSIVAVALTASHFAYTAHAHFPWIAVNDDGQAIYFFGETLADRTYKLPASVSGAVVQSVSQQGIQPIDVAVVESDDFVGLRSDQTIPSVATLASKVTYGVYHGSRLDYYSQHARGKLPSEREDAPKLDTHLELHADLVDTENGVDVFVVWQGKPLVDAKVRLFCAEGHEEGTDTTDQHGKVSFNDRQVEDGLNGIMVGYTATDDSGQLGEHAYGSVSHYLTATFVDPQDFESNVSVDTNRFPQIAEAVTSFGAAIAGDDLYVYGGHVGEAHQYYSEAQANTLRRLNLANPSSWEELGQGPRLQGLAMVAHGGKLYRLGGFTAKNKQGNEKDLWSQAGVACFDPSSQQWEDLPSLPEPRSSFDAVVLSDHIYVVGGWSMQGDEDSAWHKTAYSLDLSADAPPWTPLPEPPFQRRALSVAALDGKIYAIGGMQSEGGPTTQVDVYDTTTQTWSLGPNLKGEAMNGFGSSSFSTGGHLYATTYDGSLQRLADDGGSWEVLHLLERDRFFHRLLPINDHELLIVGGASMSSGKFEELDVIELP